jgi:uncharacterized protein (DUF1697 family)
MQKESVGGIEEETESAARDRMSGTAKVMAEYEYDKAAIEKRISRASSDAEKEALTKMLKQRESFYLEDLIAAQEANAQKNRTARAADDLLILARKKTADELREVQKQAEADAKADEIRDENQATTKFVSEKKGELSSLQRQREGVRFENRFAGPVDSVMRSGGMIGATIDQGEFRKDAQQEQAKTLASIDKQIALIQQSIAIFAGDS